jgi:hypothetical protein
MEKEQRRSRWERKSNHRLTERCKRSGRRPPRRHPRGGYKDFSWGESEEA